jgi:hypothetical protein
LGISVFELPIDSGYQSFVWCISSKYFLPLCGWSLQFRDHFFFFYSYMHMMFGSFLSPSPTPSLTHLETISYVVLYRSFLILCSSICPSFLLVACCWSSTEEVLAYTYCFLYLCSSICPSFLLVAGCWSSTEEVLAYTYTLFFHVLTSEFQVWY